jgi:hypothetical protein
MTSGFLNRRRWVLVLGFAGLLVLGLAGGHLLLPHRPIASAGPIRFADVTERAGIRFVHFNGAFGKKLLPETMGSGVAVIDYDNDGRPDLLFVNSAPWPGQPSPSAGPPTLALYRNRGDGTFEDVTEQAGLKIILFGMGATVGDYDNDGWPDLFITAVGGNRLFRNVPAADGGRRFQDVTSQAGVAGPGGWPRGSVSDFLTWSRELNWSTSAAFLDYDGDGRLDLFVCNYVRWSPVLDLEQRAELATGERAYGPPRAFSGTHCFLYRNRGDGTFEDVSEKAGVQVFHGSPREKGEAVGKSLGVVVCDVDEDGWPDVIVANDTVRNFFFHNVAGPDGTRRFEEVGEWTGVAYADRHARGAMGIDWIGDYRSASPGATGTSARRAALLIGNFAEEPDTLLTLERPRELAFLDRAPSEGIAGPSRMPLKFGVFFFDCDRDGLPDLLTCNGHLEPDIARALPGQTHAQAVQLFRNRDNQLPRFELVTGQEVADLLRPLVGRGCAYLDFDGDGSLDVVLTANGGPARLLRNEGGAGNHWVRLRLEGDGVRSNKSALGARVVLEAGGRIQRREVASSRGYLSGSELVVTFGLGQAEKIDRLTIHWPGREAGAPTVQTDLACDREYQIRQP